MIEALISLAVLAACFWAAAHYFYKQWRETAQELEAVRYNLRQLQRTIKEAKQDETRYNDMPDADIDAFLRK